MSERFFVEENGRVIPKEDKIFGINSRAKERIKKEGRDKVVNGTIGSLLDSEGKLIVLSSVADVFRELEPTEFADYAPIVGTMPFRDAVKKAAMGEYEPKAYVEAVATPGGTGAIRNTVANFSKIGDKILTADWFWAPYKTIANEIGRELETFRAFDEKMSFVVEDLERKIGELLKTQDNLVLILNTPAHNPTGYSLTDEDWNTLKEMFNNLPKGKKLILLVDVAYIDFAGEEEEVRSFLPILEEMGDQVLPLMAYSLSKAYTLYGQRCGALICLAKSEEIAMEFRTACQYSSRGSWSNSPKAPQVVLEKIYGNKVLKKRVDEERKTYRDMLLKRGATFEQAALECGLRMLPFDGGFFVSIPNDQPERVCQSLEEKGVFLVPLDKGIRVSIASISEKVCGELPRKILEAIEQMRESSF